MTLTKTTKVKKGAIGQSRFTLNRTGAFLISTFGDTHCGTVENLQVYYDFKTTVSADSIDARGFLFDQMNVKRFFDSLKSTSLSCELLTLSCARQLLKLIRTENTELKVFNMSLTLRPAPFEAGMTFEWTA